MSASAAERPDLLVIGGGSAGCVVAARASEDPSVRVLLVEAGPDPRPIPDVIANPKRQAELILESPYVRLYDVEREDGSGFPLVSGRVMGGGSSVNNMSFIRPLRQDCAAWTRFGGEAWSYQRLLPTMIALEDDVDFAGDPLHGTGGPLRLHRSWKLSDPADPPVRALLEAAVDLGLPLCDDLNGADPYGVVASPYSQVGGKRLSVTTAYLDPARGRPNLAVEADTTVTRLLLDGSRVVGAELAGPGGTRVVEADRIVLAAGAYQTPHLLLHSGIGPAEAIEAVGLPVRHRLDGVGQNFQDHAVVYMTFQGTTELHEDYLIPKVRLLAKTDPAREVPDLHVFLRPSIRMEGIPPLLPVSIHLLEDRARGRITLASADPFELPRVEPAILSDPGDVQAMLAAMRFVMRLVAHPRMAEFYGALVSPEGGEAAFPEHVATSWITYNHATGTCRMGPAGDPLAVVDPELRVHGLDNLWIADMSVIPVIPHATTNLTAILIGEVAARNLARDATPA